MSVIAWIIVGLIAGWVGTLITGDRENLISTILLGMAGALVGGLLVELLQGNGLDLTTAFTTLSFTSIVVSTLGAILLVMLFKAFRHQTSY